MKWLWSKRWVRVTVGIMATILLIGFGACWRYRIWSVRDGLAYQHVVRRYSFGRDLWIGNIRAGQPVEQFISGAPPHDEDQYGPYTSYAYYPGGPLGPNELPFEGLEIVAKDGRLVRAWASSCTWDCKFFDMNAADTEEYERMRTQIIDERYRRYLERVKEQPAESP